MFCFDNTVLLNKMFEKPCTRPCTRLWTTRNAGLFGIFDSHLIPFWLVWLEIKYKVHITLPKRPINQFKPVQQSRQQELIFLICILWMQRVATSDEISLETFRLSISSIFCSFSFVILAKVHTIVLLLETAIIFKYHQDYKTWMTF